ncbi:hypothetical protein SDC9_102340 [bioreactor metagenome]|uniref:Uncharacterized protein n=1 Tax=bioreactor metagenome TaxID=1076179 RepID=A0A645AXA7_9ZZZZ
MDIIGHNTVRIHSVNAFKIFKIYTAIILIVIAEGMCFIRRNSEFSRTPVYLHHTLNIYSVNLGIVSNEIKRLFPEVLDALVIRVSTFPVARKLFRSGHTMAEAAGMMLDNLDPVFMKRAYQLSESIINNIPIRIIIKSEMYFVP